MRLIQTIEFVLPPATSKAAEERPSAMSLDGREEDRIQESFTCMRCLDACVITFKTKSRLSRACVEETFAAFSSHCPKLKKANW